MSTLICIAGVAIIRLFLDESSSGKWIDQLQLKNTDILKSVQKSEMGP